MNDELDFIYNAFETGYPIIFCGAGISKNSGLPIANSLTDKIFDVLSIPNSTKEYINNLRIPFESFIELLKKVCSIDMLLEIFKMGTPTSFHYMIANLAEKNIIKIVITTNFDCLIEKALNNIPHKLYYKEDQFSNINWFPNHHDPIQLIKLHGSAHEFESIRATLDQITLENLSQKRRTIIRDLFTKGAHQYIMFFGYSCSDVFDINPQIEFVQRNNKSVIFIDHSTNESNERKEKLEIEDLSEKKVRNPFKNFTASKRIFVDTDIIINKIYKHFFQNPRDEKKYITHWESLVELWADEQDQNYSGFMKNMIAALIYLKVNLYNSAIDSCEKTWSIISKSSDIKRKLVCLSALSEAYFRTANYKKALDHLNQALRFANKIEDKNIQTSLLMQFGAYYLSISDCWKALSYYRNALYLAKQFLKSDEYQQKILGNMGTAYRILGEYDSAIQHLEQAQAITQITGNKSDELIWFEILGSTYFDKGEYVQALYYYEQAIKIARLLGDNLSINSILGNIGNVHCMNHKYDKALSESYIPALKIALQINNLSDIGIWFGNIGRIYLLKNDNRLARMYLHIALNISERINDNINQARWLTNLGIVYRNSDNSAKAIFYGEKAAELFKNTLGVSHKDTYWANNELLKSQHPDKFEASECNKSQKMSSKDIGNILTNVLNNFLNSNDFVKSICFNSEEHIIREMYRENIGDDSCLDEYTVRKKLAIELPAIWKRKMSELSEKMIKEKNN